MEKFRQWLKENSIDASITITEAIKKPVIPAEDVDAEADDTGAPTPKKATKPVKATTAPVSTFDTLQKLDLSNEVEEVFGANFVSDEDMESDDFSGLFYKTETDRKTGRVTRKLCVGLDTPAFNIIKSDPKSVFVASGANWTYTLPSGAQIKMHQSSKKKGFKYIKNTTAFQESVFALLMQFSVDGKTIPTSANKLYAKYNVMGWMMESDVTTKSGIWKYLNYNVPADDAETFYDEVKTILTSNSNGWRNSFEAVSKVDWREKINGLFNESTDAEGNQVTPPAWESPLFIHDNLNIKAGRGLKEKVAAFLRGTRCGVPKDEVDKTDVLLIFNSNTINPVLDKIASFTDKKQIDEHNKYINDLINGGVLLGISLKQTGKNVVVSAVNFNISTNAVGDNIKNENKVMVVLDTKNAANSTLDCAHALKPKFSDSVVTYPIIIPINEGHEHDLHLPEGSKIAAIVRVGGGAVQINFGVYGAKAFLGKGNDAFKGSEKLAKDFGYEGINATAMYKAAYGNPEPGTEKTASAKAIYKVVTKIHKLIVTNPSVFLKIFAKSIGYPLAIKTNKKTDYEIVSTPYVKIY